MQIRRGDIWWIQFDPSKGDEMRNLHPGVVINSPGMGDLDLNIVVPITGWSQKYSHKPWFVKLMPNKTNGLTKPSGADAFQVKSLSRNRIKRSRGKIGEVKQGKLKDITAAVALCIDYSP